MRCEGLAALAIPRLPTCGASITCVTQIRPGKKVERLEPIACVPSSDGDKCRVDETLHEGSDDLRTQFCPVQ